MNDNEIKELMQKGLTQPTLQTGLLGGDARQTIKQQNAKNQAVLQNMQAMNAQSQQAAQAANNNLQQNMQAQQNAASQQAQNAASQQQAQQAMIVNLAMKMFGM